MAMNASRSRKVLGLALVQLACAAMIPTTAPAATDEFQQAIADDEPVLWYQFNETSGVAVNYGSLGTDYNADYLGTPIRGNGTEAGDKSVRFDSVDDYLESDAVSPVSLDGNPTFSAEALFFVVPDGGATTWAPLLHWGVLEGGPTMKSAWFSFSQHLVHRMYAGFYNGGLRTSADIPRGSWHHYVWVRQGGGAANVGTTVYIDGVAVGLEDDSNLCCNGQTPDVVGARFRVNRARDYDRWFTGAIDELALYDKALSAVDVEEHYDLFLAELCEAETFCIDYDGGCKACAQPATSGVKPSASDALAVLRRAVGTRGCNLCICDVDNSGNVVATDALLTLKYAVGQDITIGCPAPA
jgi:hypothetical protein